MVYDLSGFRNIEDFNFRSTKYWRVDVVEYYTQQAEFWYEGSSTWPPYDDGGGVHQEFDPDDPFYPGPNPIGDDANWPAAWQNRLRSQGKGYIVDHPGTTYSKQIYMTRTYTRLFGSVIFVADGPYTMGFWVFTADMPQGSPVVNRSGPKYFVTTTPQQEADLPATVAAWFNAWRFAGASFSSTMTGPVQATKAEYDARPPEP